jgi:hypothetical protein
VPISSTKLIDVDSNEPTIVPAQNEPEKRSLKIDLHSPAVRMVVAAGCFLLMLALVVYGLESKAANRVNAEIARGVDALSGPASLFIIQNSPDRTKKFVDSVQSAGDYQEVTLTDGSGKVLASTDAAKNGTAIPLPSPAISQAKLSTVGGDTKVVRTISIGGDNVIGMLIITLKP